jgi:hypothetical protein
MIGTNRRMPCGTAFALTVCGLLLISAKASAAGGTCPSTVNYLNTTTNTLVTLSSLGITKCYYISAAGADTNNGTSESTPWLHAPGMASCSGVCGSTTPVAGEGFIFRGGDTWHEGNSSLSPYSAPQSCDAVTCSWYIQWSGSAGSPIYFGIDPTWYSGSSWARPILTRDNALSSTFVSSCSYDDSSITRIQIVANYVTLDNFDIQGACWASLPSNQSGDIWEYGTHITISNSYFHGWSTKHQYGNAYDHHVNILGYSSYPTYNVTVRDVFDGSDSSHDVGGSANCTPVVNTGSPCNSGFAMYFDAYDVHQCVFRYLSNGIIATDRTTTHDNLFEYLYNSFDDYTHPNVVEDSGNMAGVANYFYNNSIRNTNQNVTFWPQFDQAEYFFNNVFFNTNGGANCILQSPVSSGSHPVAYIYNNTLDVSNGGCSIDFTPGNAATPSYVGTANFENNHFIGYGGSSLSSVYTCPSPSSCTINDNGYEIFQSEAKANAQGYTSSNNYQPAAGGATVGAGANLTSSCSIFSPDSALCSGTSMGVSENSGSGGQVASYPAIPLVARPTSSAWDAGAYLLVATTPNPPTNVTAEPH